MKLTFTRTAGFWRPALFAALALGVLPQTVQASAAEAREPLTRIDCAGLTVDMLALLPEAIAPQAFVLPDPPFKAEDLERIGRAAERDPAGLCRYHEANAQVPAPTNRRVVFIGDSITEYWPRAAPALFAGDVVNRGVAGQTTGQMLLRFQQDVIALRPKVVHILGGINDAMNPNGTAATRSNVVSMVELARAHGITVVLGTMTPAKAYWLAPGFELSAHVQSHNAWLRAYAAREGIVLADYDRALAAADGTMPPAKSNDGLHPNRLGFAAMTPQAARAIAAALASLKPAKRKR